ncbi:MAG: hypothetical protein Q9221_009151, partial [Calogaya cf. arnoldii]
NQTVNPQKAGISASKIALPGAGANGSFSVASTGLLETNNLRDDELHAHIAYRPKAMDQADIFMAMIGVMLKLAPTDQQPLGVFKDDAIAITHEVISIFNRAAKSVPYVITTGDLTSLVADVPGFLLQNNKWQEMDLTVTANEFPGVVIARGSIRVGSFSFGGYLNKSHTAQLRNTANIEKPKESPLAPYLELLLT